ncbi:pseudouridine synthase [Chitinophaga solisilvae]|nr:pseudouridine synthase [Chitinophaga solisilvae]
MKKKIPAKKGTAPFKGRKTDNTGKPAAGNRNSSSFDGERPGRTSAKNSFSGDEKPAFRKRSVGGDEPVKGKRSFSRDNTGDDKPTFRKRSVGSDEPVKGKRSFSNDNTGDDKPTFRKRTYLSTGKSGDEQPRRRTFGNSEKPAGKRFSDNDDKPAFRKRSFGEDKKSFGKKSSDAYAPKDESAFHGGSGERKGPKHKDTPSGFNRKKFFDRTNDRFADKHEKHTRIRKADAGTESPKPKKESKESIFGPGEMPLNKYIAHCGLCSRRKAVDFIKDGKVTVNGQTVTEPATKVTAKDVVTLQDKKINLTKNLVYILLNKPKGFITTTDDPEGRKTVMDLIKGATEDERVYPVGRLDRNTSGLLLLTNDGELAQTLAHPKHNIKKIYQVELDKPLTKGDFEKIIAGLTLEDGVALVDALGYVDPKDKKQIGIEIHSGKNRIVRRIFEHLSYSVEKLDRVMYAGLTKKTLNRGQWRHLSEKEVILLKHFKK